MGEGRTIAVLGAGHGGFAAAADLVRRGFAVHLYGRSAATIDPIRDRGGIEYAGSLGDGFAPLARVSGDIAAAIDGADLVVLMVPTHAHEEAAGLAAPHLTSDQVFMVSPGHTCLLVPSVLRRAGHRNPVTCETGTLPYICRKESPVRIRINKANQSLAFAAFPGRETARLHALVKPAFPAIRPVGSVLETVFPYTNAIHHPPATLMNAGRIEATGGDYYHYYDGISPGVGRVIDALDRERIAVGAELGIAVTALPEHFLRMGYTTEAARDSGLAYEVFHQSEPDRWIRAPQSLDYRFLTEDIPFGLVPLAALGRLAGVATPLMDHVITLATAATGTDYRARGLSLERMGLAGVARERVADLLHNGFSDQGKAS
ncbi:MAG: NADP transhydrogenase subunit alpha [Alphaproteobacteria bacterium]|nr:NADP transhydrogenase subunit alpha [Alphaproteobacteria bacterium]